MEFYSNENVRRQDRLLDKQSAITLLRSGEYGVLSMVEIRDSIPAGYGIPLNYVWDEADYIYIHCGPDGHKLDCIDANPLVSFCVVGHTNVISNKFTTAYESLVIRGKISRNLIEEERKKALRLILMKYSPDDMEIGMKYAEKSFHRTEILRIAIDEISGKNKIVN